MAVRAAAAAKRGSSVPSRRWDVLVLVTGALSVLAVGWFLLNLREPWGWPVLGWLPGPVALGLAAVGFLRLGHWPALQPPAPLTIAATHNFRSRLSQALPYHFVGRNRDAVGQIEAAHLRPRGYSQASMGVRREQLIRQPV